jgi:hypothetical protein
MTANSQISSLKSPTWRFRLIRGVSENLRPAGVIAVMVYDSTRRIGGLP